MSSFSPLPHAVRADLFSQLAVLERAGLPTEHALTSLNLAPRYLPQLAAMRKALARGKTIAQAGVQAGLFNPLDAALIAASCHAGSPALLYSRLAEQSALIARLTQQVRAKLAMPALTLLLALLINPLPALIMGSLSLSGYALGVITPLLLIYLMYRLGRLVLQSFECNTSATLVKALLQTPLLGAWYLRSKQHDFIASLALLLHAGVSMFEAIPIAQSTLNCAYLQQQTQPLLRQLKRGQTLTAAFSAVPWLADPRLVAMVETGEASGTLPDMLQRVANQQSADLAHSATQLAAWLPRLIYVLIAGWIAWGILTSGAMLPQVPADL
ncbi:type II secretion system F family protein [uncultured Deefgea sp.]|uniref:type II secretion system F family protein n=1 Tax=uncultured Deefgea sp. TaxID=1304914 RepID=UPI0026184C42|nr:type II secretion system F family protein [uncultured Deefgea sp.]